MQMRHTVSLRGRPQRWMRAGSILISFAAITLLATAFGARLYSGSLSSVLLTLVLIALCVAIVLHVRFLLLARREQRETASALDATEREYKSVFDNTLDGILILDDQGICLEANRAALSLFGADHDAFVGEPIGKFYAGTGDFKETWNRFLDRKHEHSEGPLPARSPRGRPARRLPEEAGGSGFARKRRTIPADGDEHPGDLLDAGC